MALLQGFLHAAPTASPCHPACTLPTVSRKPPRVSAAARHLRPVHRLVLVHLTAGGALQHCLSRLRRRVKQCLRLRPAPGHGADIVSEPGRRPQTGGRPEAGVRSRSALAAHAPPGALPGVHLVPARRSTRGGHQGTAPVDRMQRRGGLPLSLLALRSPLPAPRPSLVLPEEHKGRHRSGGPDQTQPAPRFPERPARL